jgi:hypothetical protein
MQMNWKFEKVDGGYKLYYEGFYPLPKHVYPLWWPVLNPLDGAYSYLFKSFDDMIEKTKEFKK